MSMKFDQAEPRPMVERGGRLLFEQQARESNKAFAAFRTVPRTWAGAVAGDGG